jgi:calcineurin-like phosphoesterase family protein
MLVCLQPSNASNSRGTRREHVNFNTTAKDLLHATCGDAHLTQNKSRHIDLFLKLCCGRPIMINQNLEVDWCEANGAHCTFEGVQLKPGVTINDLETVQIGQPQNTHTKIESRDEFVSISNNCRQRSHCSQATRTNNQEPFGFMLQPC